MGLNKILIIAGIVCLGLAAFGANVPRVNLTPLGLFFIALTLVI